MMIEAAEQGTAALARKEGCDQRHSVRGVVSEDDLGRRCAYGFCNRPASVLEPFRHSFCQSVCSAMDAAGAIMQMLSYDLRHLVRNEGRSSVVEIYRIPVHKLIKARSERKQVGDGIHDGNRIHAMEEWLTANGAGRGRADRQRVAALAAPSKVSSAGIALEPRASLQ